MFKSIALLAVIGFAIVNAGVIATHTVVQAAVANVGAVVHSVPSAVSHQSFTRLHNHAVVSNIVAPVVKNVQVAPVQHVVNTIAVSPVVKSVHVAPVSHLQYATPVVSSYAAAPVQVHAASVSHIAPAVHAQVLKTVVSPVTYAVHH